MLAQVAATGTLDDPEPVLTDAILAAARDGVWFHVWNMLAAVLRSGGQSATISTERALRSGSSTPTTSEPTAPPNSTTHTTACEQSPTRVRRSRSAQRSTGSASSRSSSHTSRGRSRTRPDCARHEPPLWSPGVPKERPAPHVSEQPGASTRFEPSEHRQRFSGARPMAAGVDSSQPRGGVVPDVGTMAVGADDVVRRSRTHRWLDQWTVDEIVHHLNCRTATDERSSLPPRATALFHVAPGSRADRPSQPRDQAGCGCRGRPVTRSAVPARGGRLERWALAVSCCLAHAGGHEAHDDACDGVGWGPAPQDATVRRLGAPRLPSQASAVSPLGRWQPDSAHRTSCAGVLEQCGVTRRRPSHGTPDRCASACCREHVRFARMIRPWHGRRAPNDAAERHRWDGGRAHITITSLLSRGTFRRFRGAHGRHRSARLAGGRTVNSGSG